MSMYKMTYNCFGMQTVSHHVDNSWFTGTTDIHTYSLEELALTQFPKLNVEQIVQGFAFYMERMKPLSNSKAHDFDTAMLLVRDEIVSQLP